MAEQPTLMIVHAHPDDEVIGTGGTLLRYREEGVRTVLVTATLGDEGEIVAEDLNTPENKAHLAEIRRVELARAVEILRIADHELLGYRDSGMEGQESNADPACFNMADPTEATGRLVRLVRQYRPQVLVSYNAHGGYGHPDHIACHRATVAAFAAAADAAQYPEYGPAHRALKLYEIASPRELWLEAFAAMKEMGMLTLLDRPDFPIEKFTVPLADVTTAIDVMRYSEAKMVALRVHRTQIREDSWFYSMPEDLAARSFGREHYTLRTSHVALPPHDGAEGDLFAGIL